MAEPTLLAQIRLSFAGAGQVEQAVAARIGRRPRRMGRFVQLALAGAIDCVAQIGRLPREAGLVIASNAGVWPELEPLLARLFEHADPPTPYEFLAVQETSACIAIASQFDIHGPCLFVAAHPAAIATACEMLLLDAPLLLVGAIDPWVSDWKIISAARPG